MASKLPAAPLVEVIFEYRWALSGEPNIPLQFQTDPGYAVMADNFATAVGSLGFPDRRLRQASQAPPLIGHSVHFQFAPDKATVFPLAQIGPGILASNDGSDYEWGKFKARTLDFVRVLYESYPAMSSFSINPVHVELRYVDSFNLDLLDHSDVVKFLNENSGMKLAYPKGSYLNRLGAVSGGRVLLTFPMKDASDTHFAFEIADGKLKEARTVFLFTKVITKAASISVGKTKRSAINFVDSWLEKAHGVTSPFFQDFVSAALMRKFGAQPRKRATIVARKK